MEYYYIGTINPDIILKTEKLVTDDVRSFDAVIVRMSDEHQEELAHEVGDESEGWCPAYFKLMTDEDLKNEGITREYLYQELPDGGYIIVREMKYYKDGKKFDGILDYFSKDDNMLIGDLVSGNTSDYKKIDGMERDSMILLERENLVLYDNWLTSSSTIDEDDELPKFTVVYLETVSPIDLSSEIKTVHLECEEDEIMDYMFSVTENPFKVHFVYEGHLEPIKF